MRAHLVIPSEQSAFQVPTCCPLISFSFKESHQAPALCSWLGIRYDKNKVDQSAFNHWLIYSFIKTRVFEPRGRIRSPAKFAPVSSDVSKKCHCVKTAEVLDITGIRYDTVTVSPSATGSSCGVQNKARGRWMTDLRRMASVSLHVERSIIRLCDHKLWLLIMMDRTLPRTDSPG